MRTYGTLDAGHVRPRAPRRLFLLSTVRVGAAAVVCSAVLITLMAFMRGRTQSELLQSELVLQPVQQHIRHSQQKLTNAHKVRIDAHV
jgi:hypothetical protein